MSPYNCIVVTGPTASGKTSLACKIAAQLNGEIISADSRQVYTDLTIGTGKDLQEYVVNEKKIGYHLIDIRGPGEQYFLHEFIKDCSDAFDKIIAEKKIPVICGGTGLYLDSLRKDLSLTQIKEDPELRIELEKLEKEELIGFLKKFPEENYAHVDVNSKKRIIRAIEIAKSGTIPSSMKELKYKPYYICIDISAEDRKSKIRKRLEARIKEGLINEAENLLRSGISHERLKFLGLEYKFLSMYLQKEITLEEMKEKLLIAIVQFSKRQMTWFRKMEKEGVELHWVKSEGTEKILRQISEVFPAPSL
jgi:tRNA dimethylallyltransferase